MSESNKIRFGNIGRLAILGTTVLTVSYLQKTPPNLLVLKLLIVPMFWLAMIGLRYLYKNPISEQKTMSTNVIEYHLLLTLLFSGFIILVLWSPELGAATMVRVLLALLALGIPLLLYLHKRQTTHSRQ